MVVVRLLVIVLSTKISALEAFTISWFPEFDIHTAHFIRSKPHPVRVVTVRQRNCPFPQKTLATTVTFLKEASRGYYRRLNLAIACSFALIHRHFPVARSL